MLSWTSLCSNLCYPPWLLTPSWHSGILRASIWTYPVFFPMLSMLTWNTLKLQVTWGFYLNHVHQLSLSLRIIQSYLDNVLLEHGGLPCVLPYAVHQRLLIWKSASEFIAVFSHPKSAPLLKSWNFTPFWLRGSYRRSQKHHINTLCFLTLRGPWGFYLIRGP